MGRVWDSENYFELPYNGVATLLSVEKVVKSYTINEGGLFSPKWRIVPALREVSFTIRNGETLAVLGRNGSGKSTLCKIVAGITKPDSGAVFLDGEDITRNVTRVSKQIGIVLGPTLIYFRMRGHDYLEFFAKIYGIPNYEDRIEELSEDVGLGGWIGDYVESYSTGMKMKLSLARALLHDPPLLILDEFTMGLDPTSAKQVRELVQGKGKSILLTTHNTLEAETMADRIAFISEGKLVAINETEMFLRDSEFESKLSFFLTSDEGTRYIQRNFDAKVADDGRIQLLVRSSDVSKLIRDLDRFGVRNLEVRGPNLEDLYSKYTGKTLQAQLVSA